MEALGGLQPVVDPTGAGVWEPRCDKKSDRVYWVNHVLQQTSWEPPSQPDDESGAEQEVLVLPEGWEQKIDEKSGRLYYMDHVNKTTSWVFPIEGKTKAFQLATQQSECVVCFDAMYREPCGIFMRRNKRACRHFLHYRCAMQLRTAARKAECPVCRAGFDSVKKMPDIDRDMQGWFKMVDFDGTNKLTQAEISDVLCAQYPIDSALLEKELPSLWTKWDVSGTGTINIDDLKHAQVGLLAFIRKEFLQKEVSWQSLPDIADDRRGWFLFFSAHNNTMQQEEVVRALIKSYEKAQDGDWMDRIREVVDSTWALTVTGAVLDLETFLAPGGFAERIVDAVLAFASEESLSAAAIAAGGADSLSSAPPPLGREASLLAVATLARERSSGTALGLPRSTSGLSKEQEQAEIKIVYEAAATGAEGLPRVLATLRLRSDNPSVLVAGCRAMREQLARCQRQHARADAGTSVSDEAGSAYAAAIAEEGGTEVLLKSIKEHGGHWVAQQEGLGLLSKLLPFHSGARQTAMREGAASLAVQAMVTHESNALISTRACEAIAALANGPDVDVDALGALAADPTAIEGAACSGVEIIIERIKANVFNTSLIQHAIGALHALSGSDAVKAKVKGCKDAVATVVNIMGDHWDPPLHIAACQLLERWLPLMAEDLRAAGAPKAVVEVVGLWVSELEAKEAALRCCAAMALLPELKADLLAADAVSKIQESREFLSVSLLPSDPLFETITNVHQAALTSLEAQ